MFIIDDLLLAMAAEAAASAAAGTAATAAATALPAAGMAATGGLLGTGAGAFGASALPAGLGALEGLGAGGGLLGSAGQGIGGSLAAAGMPASTAPFSAMLSPSTIGSYGLGEAATGAAGNAASGGLAQQFPGVTEFMQNNGMLGHVTDATGGMETATTNPNNVGGGLLGNIKNKFGAMNGKDLMLNGMKMAGQAMSQPQQQPAPQGRAQSPYQGQQQPMAPTNTLEAQRKKRDELLRQMMGIR